MGIGDGSDQAVCALDGHIAVGGLVAAVDVIGGQAQCHCGVDQILAFGIIADAGEQGGLQAKAFERHGDIHGDTTRQPCDAAGAVGAQRHGGGVPADDVPQDGANAEDIGCHAGFVAEGMDWRKHLLGALGDVGRWGVMG